MADPALTARQTFAYYTRRKPWAATINTLANALYKARQHALRALARRRLTATRDARAGVLRHGRVVERGDAAGVLRLLAPGRHLRAGPHLAAVRPQPAALHPRRPFLHGRALRGAAACSVCGRRGAVLTRSFAALRRWAACFCRCPHHAACSWPCACCSAPAPSSCPSSARRACARFSSRGSSAARAPLPRAAVEHARL